jgi:hypothetical protein
VKDLIEKLERASGPSRELDEQIKLALAAQSISCRATYQETVALVGGNLDDEPLAYTGSLATWRRLVPPDCSFSVGDTGPNDCPLACVTRGSTDYTGEAATPELALCIAALRARSDGGEG